MKRTYCDCCEELMPDHKGWTGFQNRIPVKGIAGSLHHHRKQNEWVIDVKIRDSYGQIPVLCELCCHAIIRQALEPILKEQAHE